MIGWNCIDTKAAFGAGFFLALLLFFALGGLSIAMHYAEGNPLWMSKPTRRVSAIAFVFLAACLLSACAAATTQMNCPIDPANREVPR